MLDSDLPETISVKEYTRRAYLDYSMYVINDRALPHLSDGLKPVQRRIVYAMSELGLSFVAKHVKSARTVGDVLGKFHPHGDSACYEAMVLMAQDFSFRYPLVDGQGNWGALDDPKSFAAMRYTEAKLSRFAALLLEELRQGTVDFALNFDGSLLEPVQLPARVPFLLLNGSTGIAVGMATDIPPHNMTEVIQACIFIMDNPQATLDEIMQIIPGPDYPTGGQLVSSKEDLRQIYSTGKGTLRVRATYQIVDNDIIIDSLPFQVSATKAMTQIAQQMQRKDFAVFKDIKDESDEEHPVRIVLVAKSGRVEHYEQLMRHLFAVTDLEKTLRVNLNMIGLDQRPKVYSLDSFLCNWLQFRESVVRRRIEYRLEKLRERLHILEGILVVHDHLDEVIRIIRTSDTPKADIMEKFSLTEVQATAILEMRLRQLAKLEEDKLRKEVQALLQEQKTLEGTLASKVKMKRLMRKELEAILKEYADERRTLIQEAAVANALDEQALIKAEDVTVILSKHGWIRMAKGHDHDVENMNYRAGDAYFCSVQGRSNDALLLMDDRGRTYSMLVHVLPSARTQGVPVTGHLTPDANAKFCGMCLGATDITVILVSSLGYGFVTSLEQLITKNKKGRASLNVSEGYVALPPIQISTTLDKSNALIALVSSSGYLLLFPLSELTELSKGKGTKLMALSGRKDKTVKAKTKSEYVVAAVCVYLDVKGTLIVRAGKRHLKLAQKDFLLFRSGRAKRGKLLPRGFQKAQQLAFEYG